MATNRAQRRSFFRKFGGLAAGLGSLMSGLFPETSVAASVAGTVMPSADPPLSPVDANRLYSEALNNGDVALLLSVGTEVGRLDPPTRSYNSVNGAQRAVAVLMPLTSYSTGQPIAMIYYGAATSVDANGNVLSLPIRLSIASDGVLRVALNGVTQVPDTAEAAETLFAAYFPEQYASSLDTTYGLQPSSPGTLRPQLACVAPVEPIAQPMAPQQAKTQMTVRQCKDTLLNCLRGAVFACLAGGVGIVVCVVCIAACIMGTWGTGCFACVVACGGAVTGGGACFILVKSCRDQYVRCMRECKAPVNSVR